jgi:ABC-type sugar transport system substrate-binding protein
MLTKEATMKTSTRGLIRATVLFLIVVLLAAASFAAGNEEQSSDKMRIGVSIWGLSAEYNATLKDRLVEYVEINDLEDEVELIILDAQSDAELQNTQVDNLITQQVDAIIMIALETYAQVPAVEAAYEAGIPMIELCTATVSDKKTTYVGSTDKLAGQILMTELARLAGGEGNMVVLHGVAGMSAEVEREKGMNEVLEELPGINILASQVCNWSRAEAMTTLENWIQSGMDIDIVFSQNDEMAMGALKAIQGSGIDKRIYIGGIDAIKDALNAVESGELDCTVLQNAKMQAYTALEVAMRAARGEQIDKMYDIPFELVTQANLDDYADLR